MRRFHESTVASFIRLEHLCCIDSVRLADRGASQQFAIAGNNSGNIQDFLSLANAAHDEKSDRCNPGTETGVRETEKRKLLALLFSSMIRICEDESWQMA